MSPRVVERTVCRCVRVVHVGVLVAERLVVVVVGIVIVEDVTCCDHHTQSIRHCEKRYGEMWGDVG